MDLFLWAGENSGGTRNLKQKRTGGMANREKLLLPQKEDPVDQGPFLMNFRKTDDFPAFLKNRLRFQELC